MAVPLDEYQLLGQHHWWPSFPWCSAHFMTFHSFDVIKWFHLTNWFLQAVTSFLAVAPDGHDLRGVRHLPQHREGEALYA